MQPVIAVYDIGKTNKKLILYSPDYQVVSEIQTTLPEATDDDGFPCEDVRRLSGWMRSTWNDLEQEADIRVDALHFATYGASFVHLDNTGKPVTPLYSYFKPLTERLTVDLYERYGGREQFALDTASPAMGMLNSGLQLYWLKAEKPTLFSSIHRSLHLPQYCSYLFTGTVCSEHTSIGCHTALWDFTKHEYHRWLRDEEIEALLPPIQTEVKAGEIRSNDRAIPVGVGLHDSSAALVPYLQSFHNPFILVSTGTWSVHLDPFARYPLSKDQLRRDCLSYLTFGGSPVKASRLFLGGEHDHQVRRLADHFHCGTARYATVAYQPERVEKLINAPNSNLLRLQPETMKGTGPFPDTQAGTWDLSQWRSYEDAYHQLILDLACMVRTSIDLIREGDGESDIFVDGGFARNALFMPLLASLLPKAEVRSSGIAQSTALGTALMMHRYWEGEASITESRFDLKKYGPSNSTLLEKYYERNYGMTELSL
jgi:L-fuculokinase